MPDSKTVRFVELVDRGGRPEVHLAWVAPADDPALQSAVKQNRVVTVHQQFRGAHKDFGVVGFELGKNVQFLIFPKSLKAFAGRRVVGIKYELFEGAESATPEQKSRAPRAKATTEDAVVSEEDRVIAFPLAKPEERKSRMPKSAKAAKTEKRETATTKAKRVREQEKVAREEPTESVVIADEEQDPVKAEVRKALDALSAGRVSEAKRRLRALLES